MYPAVIESYDVPTSVQEALQAFAKRGSGSYFIAGGQSLMQAIKARVISPKEPDRSATRSGAERHRI